SRRRGRPLGERAARRRRKSRPSLRRPRHGERGRIRDASAPARPSRSQGPRVTPADRTPPRILVVEDDADNRGMVVKVLTVEGYTVLEAVDGASAVAAARREHPDLIVMDLGMPGMDGREASRRLKADPETADIPIIAPTAFAM